MDHSSHFVFNENLCSTNFFGRTSPRLRIYFLWNLRINTMGRRGRLTEKLGWFLFKCRRYLTLLNLGRKEEENIISKYCKNLRFWKIKNIYSSGNDFCILQGTLQRFKTYLYKYSAIHICVPNSWYISLRYLSAQRYQLFGKKIWVA